MDNQTIREQMQGFSADGYQWRFVLYTLAKGRDGVEMEFHLCPMEGITAMVEGVVDQLLLKPLENRVVEPYAPTLPKESIGALRGEDELIHQPLTDVLLGIRSGVEHLPLDFVSGIMGKPAGYGFYGKGKENEEEILFLRRGNPFLGGKTMGLYTGEEDGLTQAVRPVVKLSYGVDFILAEGVCYFLSEGIAKDFGLLNRHLAICAKRLEEIGGADLVSDYGTFEREAMTGRNARKFADFDPSIFARIQTLSVLERMEFVEPYGITLDHNGCMESFTAEACELIIDLLCCRSCLDPLGRLSTGSNITPRV